MLHRVQSIVGFAVLALVSLIGPGGCAAPTAGGTLASWREGPTRDAIVSFVERTTTPGSRDFVPPAERIAVFDNDGTLWAEQPMYFQLCFALDRVRALAPQHPEWGTTEPFQLVLAGDLRTALAGGEKAIAQIVAATHAGMTTDEFERSVAEWIVAARHPTSGRAFTDMVYQPMRELLDYLRANGYKTFIVSGGGVEFMRPWVGRAYGIPPEQVVGSRGKLKLDYLDGDTARPVLRKLPEIDLVDDKSGKPIGIQQVIGRRPVIAFGNSDGDLEMLRWTTAGPGPRFAAIVHHTDSKREWAYDRRSQIGRLDKALDEAPRRGWVVIDMSRDWRTVFGADAGE